MSDKFDKLMKDFPGGQLSRRDFLHRALLLTGSLAAAASVSDAIVPHTSHAALVDANDPALASSDVQYNAVDGTVLGGYLTRPKRDGSRPAVLIIHEWDGLKEHSRDVARRFAKAGYVALAPDLLSRYGGTRSFSTSEAAIAAGRKLDDEAVVKDFDWCGQLFKNPKFCRRQQNRRHWLLLGRRQGAAVYDSEQRSCRVRDILRKQSARP